MTTTVLNPKVGEVENKISDTSSLVTVLNTKIKEVKNKMSDHAKYITTPDFNKFSGSIFDAK